MSRTSRRNVYIWGAHLLAALAGPVAGCSSSTMPLARATGTITIEGQPIAGAKVVFRPEAGPAASGETDTKGRFVLSTYQSGDGAVIGHHSVVVVPKLPGVMLTPGQEPNAPPAPTVIIPAQYQRADSSGLVAEVAQSANDFVFDLSP